MPQLKLTIDCLSKICRTCLSTINKLKSLRNNDELIAMLTRWIKLDLNDLLPKQMCVVCITKLNIVHNFIQTITRAEIEIAQAIEQDKETLLPHLRALPDVPDSDSEDESHLEDSDSDSIAFSLPADDLFETEEHKLKIEDLEPKIEKPETGDFSRVQIANIQSIPDEAEPSQQNKDSGDVLEETNMADVSDDDNGGFKGFTSEEIQFAQNHLENYRKCVSRPNRFFDSVKYKCYLCENHLNFRCDKPDIKTLEFSNLNDDAHVLCKRRVKVLRKIIKDLYLKQDELNSLNISWQKTFLQGTEKKNDGPVAQLPLNPVNENPAKPHEIGFKKDGQVHLGHLTWIPETEFERAFRYSLNPSKFLINMALTLFGVETLAKSTITGISKHGVRKEPLNSIRMCALKSSLKYYMKEYNVPDYYQKHIWKNFNKILGQKNYTNYQRIQETMFEE